MCAALFAACFACVEIAGVATAAPEASFLREENLNQEAASRVAEHRLGQVELPAGSVPLPGEVGEPLVESPFGFEGTETVHLDQFWIMPLTTREAMHWFDDHRPAGSSRPEASPGLQMPIRRSWWWGGGARVLGSEAEVSVVDDGSGGTYARIDSGATWIVPRPRRERIPASARIIDLVVEPAVGGSSPAPRRLRIAGPGEVARITALVEGLRIAQGPTPPCVPPRILGPGERGPSYTRVLFRAGPRGHVLAEVDQEEHPGGCDLMSFSRGGHTYPELVGGGAVLRALVGQRRRAR